MHTVAETPGYTKAAGSLLTEEERARLIGDLAADPEIGSIMPGTGGFRKLRFGRQGIGKRGGVRVIYLYGGDRFPVFLISIYAKSVKTNLGKAEQNTLRKTAEQIFIQYGRQV